MATYKVQAPDGKTITLEGPDGASQEDVIAQAQALYTPPAAKPTATPTKPKPAPARKGPNVGQGMEASKVLKVYENARASLVRGISDPEEKRKRLLAFDTDPRAQAMRKNAGLAPVSTRQGEVKKIARQAKDEGGFFDAALAGAERNFFGVPERIKAAIRQYLPESKLELQERGGKPIRYGKNYQEQLAIEREETNKRRDKSLAGDITGQVVGAVTSGVGAGKLITRGVGTVAPRVGNVLQGLGTLNKGQRVRNVAKLSTLGAAGGAAQSAGEGSDVATGAATGAIAAPVVIGGVKLAQIASRPFRDVLRLSSAGQILSRLTNATQDVLERRAAQYRADTGAEPTIFEILPLADRNKILQTAVVGKDNVVEATSNAIRQRARNLGPEMSRRADEVLAPQREFIEQGIARDLRVARGGTPDPADAELVGRAARSPTDMSELRDVEARAIMAPFEDLHVVDNLADLIPSAPAAGSRGRGAAQIALDPEVAAVIRSAAGVMRQRNNGAGIAAGDITDMISTLRGDLGRGGNEARVAQRAIDHLQDTLDRVVPDAGAAARQMTDAYAARSRMAEGMKEGNSQRLRDTVQVGTNRRQAREVRNAYDTAEGTSGRVLGQGNRVLNSLAGSPEEALRATVGISRNSVGRELAQNIGDAEAAAITTAARAQDESAQALAAASQKAQSGAGDGADAEMLVQAIAGLHPATFITTKAGALRKLFDMTYIPENRARTMIDMLFSQDPATAARALRAIGNEPNGANFMKYLATATGMLVDPDGAGEMVPDMPTFGGDDAEIEEEPTEEFEAPVVEGDSPYAQDLQNVYDAESPELLDLISRVKMQESGGKHFQDDGSVTTSSAGAIGVMQVMPDTAPEAAELAGLPWDEDAYRNDPVYNELLGIAYLSEQLRKYDGDVEMALAAYNAGPGRVDQELASGASDWLANMPAETQDYVARIG